MKDIDFEDIKNAIISYEKEERSNIFQNSLLIDGKEERNILLFKGERKYKIVIISLHFFPDVEINSTIKKLTKIYNENKNLSDVVDYFSTQNIAKSIEEKMNNICYDNLEIHLNIYDRSRLAGLKAFSYLFEDECSNISEYAQKAIYDYLASGTSSSEIKTSIFNTVILFEIYAWKEISIESLAELTYKKLGNKIGDINVAINTLKRKKKIAPSKKGEKLTLTLEERQRISDVLKESNAIEKEFHKNFNDITQKYGIKNNEELFDKLVSLYKIYYQYDLDKSSDLDSFSKTSHKIFTELKTLASNIIMSGDVDEMVEEIKNLCKTNSYLNRISISSSFLSLYKSDNLEKYINNKVNYVFFDTTVFINFICVKSKYNEEIDIWDDNNFRAVYNLVKCQDKNRSKIKFCIPYDYIIETVGEFQKALKIAWFEQTSFPIQIQTANTFYNYYLYVKKQKELNGDDGSFCFIEFAKELGFTEIDPESQDFKQKTYSIFQYYAKVANFEIIPSLKESFILFDRVKSDYISYLKNNYKHNKSTRAIEADVRQALYLTERSLSENDEYYLVSWDSSIRHLRDFIKELNTIYRSYAVYKPNFLVNALELKCFKINSECITDELFVYADKNYDITSKIRSLFDDVIFPLFMASHNTNSTLITQMLSLQKEFIEIDNTSYSSSDKQLPLEEFFLDIINSLPDIPCSKTDLKDFLSSEENNEFVTTLFSQALKSLEENKPFDIVTPFADKLKLFIDKKDINVNLGE